MRRGEVYDLDFGKPPVSVVGHEPAFLRPVVVVTTNMLNDSAGNLVTVVPVTSRGYGLRSHVELQPGLNGLDQTSYVRCDQIRSVSTQRLIRRRGTTSVEESQLIDSALRFVLDL